MFINLINTLDQVCYGIRFSHYNNNLIQLFNGITVYGVT